MQPYPGVPPKPSGATAIFAAVLALAGGLWFLSGVFRWGWYPSVAVHVSNAANLVLAIPLVLGGILLLTRRPAGRVLCVVGAIPALVSWALAPVLDLLRPTGICFSSPPLQPYQQGGRPQGW